MKQKIEEKLKAIELRKHGYSLNEIIEKIGVSKSTASNWLKNIKLNHSGRLRLSERIKLGRLKSAEKKRNKTEEKLKYFYAEGLRDIDKISLNKSTIRMLCSLIYWCEGIKNHFQGVTFINSDPKLIRIFLYLLRKGYDIEESKFRICIHIHEYHDPLKQMTFWSGITNIPTNQFIKPYLKQNTGKRIRLGYEGCISLRYRNNDLARQLLMMAKACFDNVGII